MRRLLGAAVLVGGPLLLARRTRARREHVELHFDDGSTVTLDAKAPATDHLLTLAREAL